MTQQRCVHCYRMVSGPPCSTNQADACPNQTPMRLERIGQEPDRSAFFSMDDSNELGGSSD